MSDVALYALYIEVDAPELAVADIPAKLLLEELRNLVGQLPTVRTKIVPVTDTTG